MRKWILRLAVKHLLKAVTSDDLLLVKDGKVFIGKTQLSKDEVATLRGEAKFFEDSLSWSLIVGNLYWIANFKMMKEANTEIEMVNGRMMTHCIDTIEQFVEKLKTLK